VNVVDRYVDNRFSSEENTKERGREDLLLFEIKEKKKGRRREGDTVIRIEKKRHIIYQDRTKRIKFKSKKHNNTIIDYC